EADLLMKRLALGLDKSAVPLPSYVSMLHKPDTVLDRFWWQSSHEAVTVSDDARRYTLVGPSITLQTRRHWDAPAPEADSPAAPRVAKIVNLHMDKRQPLEPAFADLANLSDLALAAAIIGHYALHERANWNASAALADDAYAVAK